MKVIGISGLESVTFKQATWPGLASEEYRIAQRKVPRPRGLPAPRAERSGARLRHSREMTLLCSPKVTHLTGTF